MCKNESGAKFAVAENPYPQITRRYLYQCDYIVYMLKGIEEGCLYYMFSFQLLLFSERIFLLYFQKCIFKACLLNF